VSKFLNPKILLTIIFFSFFRFIDADLLYKGVLFILTSILLIYFPQKTLNKKSLSIIFFLLIAFSIFNEKKNIIEISAPLKISLSNEDQYNKILGSKKLNFIKPYFIKSVPECYTDTLHCFQNKNFEKNYLSPDQLIFNIDKSISRKVSQIKFTNLANLRSAFINSSSGNINRHNLYKLDTPFYVEYNGLEHLSSICFKGLVYIEPLVGKNFGKHQKDYNCISQKIKSITGFNLPKQNLQIISIDDKKNKYLDDSILLLFLVLIFFNINKNNFYKKNLKLFLPVLASTFIIFYISRFDNWFHVFDLYNFYFFGFEGGDGTTYINFTNIILNSIRNLDLYEFFRGGEDTFYFTPGLRYFLILNQLISGDFYYFYFFILFFIPKIVNKYLVNQFGEKVGYILTLSFLLLPLLHHLGFSYYQFIRYSYRLFPEPLGYMFFIAALTLFFSDFEKYYLKINLLFAISVLLRPNLIISVILIILVKTIKKNINPFEVRYLFVLSLISLIYLYPLFHNLYFGQSFTLFTVYGSKILSFENISTKDFGFYLDKLISLNFIFLLFVFIPRLNIYLKIILITQYLTIFWFDSNGRYYWIYWLVSLNLVYDTVKLYYQNKWNFIKKYISN
jgi:hypothetical protein